MTKIRNVIANYVLSKNLVKNRVWIFVHSRMGGSKKQGCLGQKRRKDVPSDPLGASFQSEKQCLLRAFLRVFWVFSEGQKEGKTGNALSINGIRKPLRFCVFDTKLGLGGFHAKPERSFVKYLSDRINLPDSRDAACGQSHRRATSPGCA